MLDDFAFRDAYEALNQEFTLVSSLIEARMDAHLTQAEIASRIGTTKSAFSRLESSRVKPSTRTLEHFAKATGHRLSIRLEPEPLGHASAAAV
jgi:transcriptional regulator with XRE-family HTH domain